MNPNIEAIKATPIQAEKSVRREEFRVLTSGKAGKSLPIAYAPMLREDRVSRGSLRVKVEMAETVKTLMNAVNVTCYCHFVPWLALERFEGSLDRLNRSYRGVPDTEGGDVIGFFGSAGFSTANPIYSVLGLHGKNTDIINDSIIEGYNAVWNYRARARSTKLEKRDKRNTTLAPAFWKNTSFNHVVPDWDQAMIDGEVELNLSGQLPISGFGTKVGPTHTNSTGVKETDGSSNTYANAVFTDWSGAAAIETDAAGIPRVFAEMAQAGVKLSLSNIEMAKKTAAFAALRKQYSGFDDDYIIDLLMEAIRVPEAQMAQPILLDRKSTIIGYNRRFATDAGNLDQSVTTGETLLNMNWRTPPMNTGGIILFTMEIVPEVLFERQKDYFLFNRDVDKLPSFTRDYLDPEKVEVIKCDEVDIHHSEPDATFGYAPLNSRWNRSIPRIGGKFRRQLGDPFSEDRQRIWAVESADPKLTEDFYVVNAIHHNIFADTESDPFEIVAVGGMEVVGHTVFGKGLQENSNDYEDLKEIVDTGRVDQGEA